MPFPPPPPPPPPPSSGIVIKRSGSHDTDVSKKTKSEKNKATRIRFAKEVNMEQEIQKKMSEILRKSNIPNDSSASSSSNSSEEEVKKPKKLEKPKKQKKKKMTKKEMKKLAQLEAQERWEKLRNVNPEEEVQRRTIKALTTNSFVLPTKKKDVKTKEDLRVNKIYVNEKARLEAEIRRLDQELERFDREKEIERRMDEVLQRKDPWKQDAGDGTKALKINSVQGRVREAIMRQEREAQEKIRMEKERKERAERQRIIRERERHVREQKELERQEQERVEREEREMREKEIRELIRREVEEEIKKIPRLRGPSCADQQCHNVIHCCVDLAGTVPVEGCEGLANRENSFIERIFWFGTMLFSLYACLDMLYQTYTKWSEAPFLTVEDENPTAVWKVPFPSVTVCSEVKIRHTALEFGTYFDDIGDRLERHIPSDIYQKLLVSSTVCELPRNEGEELMAEEELDILAEVLPQLDQTLTSCKWRGDLEDCSAFTSMFKDEGVCFNFNMLDREDVYREEVQFYSDFLFHGRKPTGWTLTGGYAPEEETDTFPRRDRPTLPYPLITHDDYNAGLVLTLQINKEDYDRVCSKEEGWRIFLHHPVEMPGIHSQYIKVEPNKDVIISITPNVISTEKLKKFPPEKRNCYYPDERNLTYYKTYTQNNCEMECLVNMTIDFCECVAFYMPRTNETEICGPVRQVCADRAKEYNRIFREAFMQNEVATEKFIFDELGTHSKYFNINVENITDPMCNCRPTCNMVTYKLDKEEKDYGVSNDTNEFDGENEPNQVARVVIRYKDKGFVPSDKIEMYGFSDFISGVGAVLGTFTGISVGTAIKMIVGNVSKIYGNVKTYGIMYWAAPPSQ